MFSTIINAPLFFSPKNLHLLVMPVLNDFILPA